MHVANSRSKTVFLTAWSLVVWACFMACSEQMTPRKACEEMLQWWEDCGQPFPDREKEISECEQQYEDMKLDADTLQDLVSCYTDTPCDKDPKEKTCYQGIWGD